MTVRGESRVRGRRRAAYRPPLPSGATETDDGVLRRSLPSSESAGRTPEGQHLSSPTDLDDLPCSKKITLSLFKPK
jgi:hypothetical protein